MRHTIKKKQKKKKCCKSHFINETIHRKYVDQCKWLSRTGFSNWPPRQIQVIFIQIHLAIWTYLGIEQMSSDWEKTCEIKFEKKNMYLNEQIYLIEEEKCKRKMCSYIGLGNAI